MGDNYQIIMTSGYHDVVIFYPTFHEFRASKVH